MEAVEARSVLSRRKSRVAVMSFPRVGMPRISVRTISLEVTAGYGSTRLIALT